MSRRPANPVRRRAGPAAATVEGTVNQDGGSSDPGCRNPTQSENVRKARDCQDRVNRVPVRDRATIAHALAEFLLATLDSPARRS